MVAGDQLQKYPTIAEILEELKRLKDTGFPIMAINLVSYLKGLTSVVCMGRLGRLELAGGALAVGFTNITGYSVLSGLAMGMEPVCSQAFGSCNLSLVSLTLQRTILMLLCASMPIGFLWLNLESIMLRLHQNADVTRVAGRYCLFALPDLIANSLLHPLRIFLRSKGTPEPLMWCTFLAVLLHVPLTGYLANTLHLGVPGVAIATFSTNFNTLFFLLCHMLYTNRASATTQKPLLTTQLPLTLPLPLPLPSSPSSSVTATSNKSLGEEWGILLRLALPSCLAVCLEWWWYEFMTLVAGYLSDPHVTLATSAIVIQTTSLMYTLPMALSASVSTRVGHELGAGQPHKAWLATMVAMALAILVSVVGLLWTTLGRSSWGRVFTEDHDVLKLTMAVLPIIGLCELVNCPQTTGCGVLRGSARPSVGATINLYSFYLVGAPVAVLLAFVFGLGFVGLCYGLLAAQIACALSIVTVISKTDWDKESLKAKDLVGIACAHGNEAPKSGEEALFLKEVAVET